MNMLGKLREDLFRIYGDESIEGVPYSEIVEGARRYVEALGGFEKFAEWGYVR